MRSKSLQSTVKPYKISTKRKPHDASSDEKHMTLRYLAITDTLNVTPNTYY